MVVYYLMKKIISIFTIFLLSINLYSADNLKEVSLQLDWKYQFQHAGFIAAVEKGFYKRVGLKVNLLEYENGVDIQEDVLNRKVDFGISNTPLLYKNKTIEPVVMLATYLQRSPLVFVTQPDIKEPYQLDGKKIMATQYEYQNSSLSLFMDHFFVKGQYIPHTYDIEAFKDKKVDAMSVFTSNEIYDLNEQNVSYNIMDPYQYGFITNAMNLFTSHEVAKNDTKMVKNFLDATRKGWQYALSHEKEIIDIIHKKYNPNKSIKKLKYEAKEIKKLMLLDLYDIGEISKELTMRSYKQLVRSDKVLPNQESKIVTFNDILNGEKNEKVEFSHEEERFLEKKGPIKLCTDPDWLPFEGLKDGKYIGLIADYFDLIREKTDLNIKVYPTKSWDQSLRALKARKCDIIGSASPTPTRLKYMNFTKAYLSPPIVLATKMDKSFINDIGDIKDKKLGVSKGYAIAEILKNKYPGINIVDVKNIKDGLTKVESGEIYGYIDDLLVIATNIQNDFHGTLKVSARLDESDELTIGSRSDEPLLNSIFQKAINSVDDSEKKEILNRWISVEESTKPDYTLAWKLLGVATIIFVLFSVYSYQLKRNNKKLKQVSREDALTKIGNRLSINEILEDRYQQSIRYKAFTGIALFDIDDFKKINDIDGHLAGDDVLKKFAIILSENIRKTDTVGRWGGEEFLVICPHTNKENLRIMAESLRYKIESYDFSLGGHQHVTTSIGLAVFDGIKEMEEVLHTADTNLYKAKSSGKNRVC